MLFVNLLFFFDLTDTVMFGFTNFVASRDYSNSYFGVSTLLESFKNLNEWPIGRFCNGYRDFYIRYMRFANGLFDNTWPNFFTDVSNPIDFVKAIFNVLINVAKGIFGIYVYMFSSILWVIYMLLMILNLTFSIFNLFTGQYVSTVPESFYDLSYCITPLFTA